MKCPRCRTECVSVKMDFIVERQFMHRYYECQKCGHNPKKVPYCWVMLGHMIYGYNGGWQFHSYDYDVMF